MQLDVYCYQFLLCLDSILKLKMVFGIGKDDDYQIYFGFIIVGYMVF